MPYLGTAPASELANLDINGEKFILDADADTSITASTDDQIDIEIAGADDFQFTANTFTAQSGSTITTPTLGVISTKDLGIGLHIKEADSGASVHEYADQLVIENNGNNGITFLGTTSSGTYLNFGDSGSNVAGQIIYDHSDTSMSFKVETGGVLVMQNDKSIYIGETVNTETSNASITINQDGADDEIFALKSSDVSHAMTSVAETDTYMSIMKAGATTGGAWFECISDTGLTGGTATFNCTGGQPDTAVGTNRAGFFRIRGASHNGSGTAADVSANGHIVSVESRRSGSMLTCFLIDEDGDTHADGSHNDTAFDDYDDVALLSASRHVTHMDKNFAKRIYGNFIQEHAQVLHDNGVITMNDDGHHFVSTKGLNGLLIDCLRQTRNIQKAFYNILSDKQKESFAGELDSMKLPVLPAFQQLNGV